MTNEFKRTPTNGENDVDLRVATEPRRVTDAVLSQIIATKDGEIAALTAEVTHLAEKLEERDASVDRNSDSVTLADALNTVLWLERRLPKGYGEVPHVQRTKAALRAAIESSYVVAPQPVDAAQAVPEYRLAEIQRNIARYGSLCHVHWPLAPMAVLEEIMRSIKNLAAPSPAAQPAAQVAVPEGIALLREVDAMHSADNISDSCQGEGATSHDFNELASRIDKFLCAQPTDTTKGAVMEKLEEALDWLIRCARQNAAWDSRNNVVSKESRDEYDTNAARAKVVALFTKDAP